MSYWKYALLAQAGNTARRIGAWVYGGYAWAIFVVVELSYGCLAKLAGRADRALDRHDRAARHGQGPSSQRAARRPQTTLRDRELRALLQVVLELAAPARVTQLP